MTARDWVELSAVIILLLLLAGIQRAIGLLSFAVRSQAERLHEIIRFVGNDANRNLDDIAEALQTPEQKLRMERIRERARELQKGGGE
jgi:hypothetical protein